MKTETKYLDQVYKINEKGAGLDTTHLNYCPDHEDIAENFGYIKTKIGCCNDHVISELIKNLGPEKRLITEINFLDRLDNAIYTHLKAIGADWIEILEIPASLTWNKDLAEKLKTLEIAGLFYDVSVKNPESVERLEEIKKTLAESGVELEYISLDLCPIEFNYDLVTWCNDNHISIIGYNPMGGNISSANIIESFTVPYLLGFAATYCHAVMLSSRDIYKSLQSAKYLNLLEGEYTQPMYVLKKSVHKLQKPLKRVVFTSANLDEDTVIPYDTANFIPIKDSDITMSLGKQVESMPTDPEVSEIEKEVGEFISTIIFPQDASKIDKFYLIESQVIEFLKNKYTDYEFSCLMINNTAIAIKGIKEETIGIFFKETIYDEINFLIAMKSNGTVYFKG